MVEDKLFIPAFFLLFFLYFVPNLELQPEAGACPPADGAAAASGLCWGGRWKLSRRLEHRRAGSSGEDLRSLVRFTAQRLEGLWAGFRPV